VVAQNRDRKTKQTERSDINTVYYNVHEGGELKLSNENLLMFA